MINQVIDLINQLNTDEEKPVANIARWEDAQKFLDLPADRVGDLIVSNNLGYGWQEEVRNEMEVFTVPLKPDTNKPSIPKRKRCGHHL